MNFKARVEAVGWKQAVGEHGWLLRFADIGLGLIDRTTLRFTRFTAARPRRSEAEPNRNTVTHVTGL
jgi:hypothetical protein